MKRRTLVLLLSLPVTLVAAAAGVALLLPAERVAAIAAERAEAALGRELRIERIEIDVFPVPAVALEGVAVAGRSADAAPLATVRRVVLRPKLLPLLARRVVVDQVVLEHPRVLVDIDASGESNLPTPPESSEPVERDGDVAFLIDRLEIAGGRFAYRDARTGTAVRLDGVDQRLGLAGELRGGELARVRLEGVLDVDALGAVAPGKLAVPVHDLRLRVVHDAVLDRTADSLALDRLEIRLQELALDGSGTVRALTASDARAVSLRLAAGPVDVAALVRSLPTALVERLAPAGGLPDVGGQASIRVAAEGPLGADTLPRVAGTLELDAFRLAWDGAGELVEGLGGRIGFTLDSLASDGLEGRLLGQPLRVAFTVRDPAAPVADVRLRTALDLERATALGLVPDSLGASGHVGVDLAVRAPLLEPATGRVDGAVSLAGIRAAPPKLLVPVRIEAGRLAFRDRRITSEDLRLGLGESDLAVDLAVDDWLPLALGEPGVEPAVRLDARSRRFDADAVLGVKDTVSYGELLFARLADRPIDGRPAGDVAAEAGFGLPALPPVSLEGRYRAGTFRRNGLEFQDLDVAFTGDGSRLELTDARFGLMGGGVQIAGRLGLSAEDAAGKAPGDRAAATAGDVGFPTVISYRIRDVGAGPFFDRLTPFRDHLAGSLLLAGTARFVLDRNLLPIRESLMAEGSMAVSGGRLANWPALRALGEKLGLARFDTLTLRDWAGEFRVTGPTVTLSESVLESDELSVRAAGVFDFAGRLDLTATLLLEPSLAGRVRGELGPRLAALTGGGGRRVPIGVRIAGSARDPDVGLDLSEAADNAVAEARDAAEARARRLAEQAARQAAARLLPGDSLAAVPADSARAKIEAEVKSKLRSLIRIRN